MSSLSKHLSSWAKEFKEQLSQVAHMVPRNESMLIQAFDKIEHVLSTKVCFTCVMFVMFMCVFFFSYVAESLQKLDYCYMGWQPFETAICKGKTTQVVPLQKVSVFLFLFLLTCSLQCWSYPIRSMHYISLQSIKIASNQKKTWSFPWNCWREGGSSWGRSKVFHFVCSTSHLNPNNSFSPRNKSFESKQLVFQIQWVVFIKTTRFSKLTSRLNHDNSFSMQNELFEQ